MSPMFKQKVGMTKIYAKGIAELFLIRCNPYHWDGSGEVPDNISFDVYKRHHASVHDIRKSHKFPQGFRQVPYHQPETNERNQAVYR